jgi:hypothetical protein
VRLSVGALTTGWGALPRTEIPNAWIRLRRSGDTFRAYHGTNGANWSLLAGPTSLTGLPASLFVGMATTSHNTSQSTVAEYRSFGDFCYSNAFITITQQPRSRTNGENSSVTFTVTAAVSNAPAGELLYQWQRSDNGGASFNNVPGATGPAYTKNFVNVASDDGDLYRVVSSVPCVSVVSSNALLRVVCDVSPPTLRYALGLSPTTVALFYSEPLPASAALVSHYSITPGISLAGGSINATNPIRVDLQISTLTPLAIGSNYTLTVTGVADRCGNLLLPNPTGQQFVSQSYSGDPNLLPVLPGNTMLAPGSLGERGFDCRLVQITAPIANDNTVAEQLLAGTYLDPSTGLPYSNVAGLPCFVENGVINYSWELSSYGHLVPDNPIPGIPGATFSTDNFAMEAVAYVELRAGIYRWGVNSDDGFRVTPALSVNDPNNAILLGEFNGGRGSADTTFDFVVPQEGLYPMRLIWEQGIGGANVEWWNFDLNSSTYTGINDPAGLKAFRSPPTPNIVIPPQSQTVDPGSDVVLKVVACPPGAVSFQWRLNGVNIPGATDSALVLPHAQPKDGGSYSVVVFNSLGAVSSQPAEVIIVSPPLPLSDSFLSGIVNTASDGIGSGDNTTATKEAGEPNHAGKVGGKSVWFTWQAPFTGSVTFSTRGSSFDTLLAAYTGAGFAGLIEVARDDDRAGFGTSTIRFNTIAGTVYHIAIDGFSGAHGPLVLCWNFLFGPPLPEIVSTPSNRVVTAGANVTFKLVANNATTYQWFLDGAPIPGATGSSLAVVNVQPVKVGYYTVRVFNDVGQFIETIPAYIEIGSSAATLSVDKFEDLFAAGAPPGFRLAAGAAEAGPIPVAAGTIDSQVLNNANSTTQAGEPNHCGALTGATRWLALRNTAGNGLTFAVDTTGSSIDTILAVYTGNDLLTLSNIACATGPGSSSSVAFPATPSVDYSVAVDGMNGQQGILQLNWKLGSYPLITLQPTNQLARQGSNVTFVADGTGVPAPAGAPAPPVR